MKILKFNTDARDPLCGSLAFFPLFSKCNLLGVRRKGCGEGMRTQWGFEIWGGKNINSYFFGDVLLGIFFAIPLGAGVALCFLILHPLSSGITIALIDD